MVQVHRSTVLLLLLLSASAGGAGVFYSLNQKLLRLQEERDGYYELSLTTMSTSQKALSFAETYQKSLDRCMARVLYEPVTTAANKPKIAGGVGGPLDGR